MDSSYKSFLAAVFLGHFFHCLLDGRELGFQLSVNVWLVAGWKV